MNEPINTLSILGAYCGKNLPTVIGFYTDRQYAKDAQELGEVSSKRVHATKGARRGLMGRVGTPRYDEVYV